MRRSLVTLTLNAMLMGVPVVAAAQQPSVVGLAGAFAAADLAAADLAPTMSAPTAPDAVAPILERRSSGRPFSLAALSVSSAVLQGLDAYTTLNGVKRGAVEANPMMRGAVGHPALFIAVKSGMTAATIYAAQKLWPRNRAAAIAMLAVTNGVMATVVAHNMSVVRQLR